MGLELDERKLEMFEMFACEIKEYNAHTNLISFETDEQLVYRHFCDSLYLAKFIKGLNSACDVSIIDLGSGAGLPGIPLAIFFDKAKVVLVEARQKRCKFLNIVKTNLSMNFEIINGRAEDICRDKNYRESFDFAMSRAMCKIGPNLELAVPFVKNGGRFLPLKTRNSLAVDDIYSARAKNAFGQLGIKLCDTMFYNLPGSDIDYCIVDFHKCKATPDMFPRTMAAIDRRPLW
jgi:16S rRNA (guanine527-N7)-methyltransferase